MEKCDVEKEERAVFSPDRVPIDIKRESLDHRQEVEIDVEKEDEEVEK